MLGEWQELCCSICDKKKLLPYVTGDYFGAARIGKEQQVKKSLSHTVWDCKYTSCGFQETPQDHLRKASSRIGEILRRLCEYKGVDLLEGKASIDHIHMCIAIPPKYSVSSIVGYLKGRVDHPV